jgi:hypothetical protein
LQVNENVDVNARNESLGNEAGFAVKLLSIPRPLSFSRLTHALVIIEIITRYDVDDYKLNRYEKRRCAMITE